MFQSPVERGGESASEVRVARISPDGKTPRSLEGLTAREVPTRVDIPVSVSAPENENELASLRLEVARLRASTIPGSSEVNDGS